MQFCSLTLPGLDKRPSGHAKHVLLEFAPIRAEYVPGLHSWHEDSKYAPTTSEKVPFAHGLQVAADVAAYAGENVPATHSRQLFAEVLRDSARYFPPAQDWHMLCPSVEPYFPGPQSLQASAPVLPLSGRNVPIGHVEQADAPVSAEYFPAEHRAQRD